MLVHVLCMLAVCFLPEPPAIGFHHRHQDIEIQKLMVAGAVIFLGLMLILFVCT